jgi:hypothetical protein
MFDGFRLDHPRTPERQAALHQTTISLRPDPRSLRAVHRIGRIGSD